MVWPSAAIKDSGERRSFHGGEKIPNAFKLLLNRITILTSNVVNSYSVPFHLHIYRKQQSTLNTFKTDISAAIHVKIDAKFVAMLRVLRLAR